MIAACPKCGARYRLERERLEAGSVRLRCARCAAVFRVRPPESGARETAAAPPTGERSEPPRRGGPASVPRAEAGAERQASATDSAAAPERDASEARVLVAMPDEALARRTVEVLSAHGLQVLRASDGVDAMLEIQRKLPRALVLAADLPKMYGFQICEVVKRNESLRGIWVVLVGAIHHRDRYRRAPGDLYGADAYVEAPDLPEGLLPLLVQGGLRLVDARPPAPPGGDPRREPRAEDATRSASPERIRPTLRAGPPPAPPLPPVTPGKPPAVASGWPPGTATRKPPLAPGSPRAALPGTRDAGTVLPAAPEAPAAAPAAPMPAPPVHAPAPPAAPPVSAPAPPTRTPVPTASASNPSAPVARPGAARPAPRGDGLDDERAKAERLARIVVSDIVLYNEERFAAAVRGGRVLEAMAADLAEGRQLFEERVDARVRAERDHLEEELLRRAEARGAA